MCIILSVGSRCPEGTIEPPSPHHMTWPVKKAMLFSWQGRFWPEKGPSEVPNTPLKIAEAAPEMWGRRISAPILPLPLIYKVSLNVLTGTME